MGKIDLSYYRNISNNNPVFLKKLMELFINSTGNEIQELSVATKNKDFKAMKEMAHKLKTLFKSYNIQKITSDILKIEEAGKKEISSNEIESIMDEVVLEFEELRAEMKNLLADFNSSPN